MIVPVGTVVLNFHLGIGADTNDDELGQSDHEIVVVQETGLHGNTAVAYLATIKQELVAGGGFALGDPACQADVVFLAHVDHELFLLFQDVITEAQQSGFDLFCPIDIVCGIDVHDLVGRGCELDNAIECLQGGGCAAAASLEKQLAQGFLCLPGNVLVHIGTESRLAEFVLVELDGIATKLEFCSQDAGGHLQVVHADTLGGTGGVLRVGEDQVIN